MDYRTLNQARKSTTLEHLGPKATPADLARYLATLADLWPASGDDEPIRAEVAEHVEALAWRKFCSPLDVSPAGDDLSPAERDLAIKASAEVGFEGRIVAANSDRLDFREIGVVELRDVVVRAYRAGLVAGRKGGKP